MLPAVLQRQVPVWFHYPYNPDIAPVFASEDPVYMGMDQANNANAQGLYQAFSCSLSFLRWALIRTCGTYIAPGYPPATIDVQGT